MNKGIRLMILFLALCLVVTGCEWNPFGIPSEFQFELETTSELGPDTLRRIDNVNRTLARGMEIGPETRELIDKLNQTIRDGAKFGFDEPTLQRVDSLLRRIEDGVKIGLDQETLETIESLIGVIDDAPGKWESTAGEIVSKLESSAGTVAGQMASEIKGLMEEARINSQKLIAVGGTEFRCNVDFLSVRAGDTINEFIGRSLIGRLQAIIAGEEAEPATPIPWVCQIIPDWVDLTEVGEKLVAEEVIITITGYNYVDRNLPVAYVSDETGQTIDSVKLFPHRTSPYQIQLNLQEIDFSAVPARSRIIFQWANVADTSAIALLLPSEPAPQPELTISVSKADVRKGPGTHYQQIGIAEHGAVYVVTGKNGDSTWWQIEYGGEIGWVSHDSVIRNDVSVSVAQDIPLPPPKADFQCEEPCAGKTPLTVQFTDLSSGEPDAWLWDFGDGGTSDEQNPAHTYISSGRYHISLTVSNAQGSDAEEKTDYILVDLPQPVADFQGEPLIGEMPLTVQFTDLSPGEPDAWLWDFGDGGSPSTEQHPAHTYISSGRYHVSLTVSNAQGSDTEEKTDYIEVALPLPKADFEGKPRDGETSLVVRFTDLSSGEPDAWLWDFGDRETSDEQNPTHTYNRAGTFAVSLTVSNARGSDTKTEQTYVIVEIPECMEPFRTTHVSEETDPVICPSGYLLKGITCEHSNCDNKELLCCPYMSGEDNSAEAGWSPLISEEVQPREQFSSPRGNEYTTKSGWVKGIWCFGHLCDNIRMLTMTTPNLRNTGQCSFIPEVSEEGDGEEQCDPGWYVAGMRCRGSYCDNVSLYCCKAE